MKKIYLHVGTFKTGTTTIQNFLSHNSIQLNEKEITFPNPIIYPSMEAHHELAAWANDFKEGFSALSLFNITNRKQKQKFDSKVEQYYKKELKNSLRNSTSILLSSEYIFDLPKDGVEKIKNLLLNDQREIKIVIYLRRVDLLLISTYKHHILTGILKENTPVFTVYSPLLGFREKLEEFIEIFGKKNLVIRIFDKTRFINGHLIDDFLSILRIDGSNLENVPYENEALSSLEMRVLKECSKHIEAFIKKEDKELQNPVWRHLTNMVRMLGLGGEKDMLVSKEEAYSLYEKYKPDYCWVKDTFFPDYPFSTLFDEDFSMYEDNYSAPELTFEQGVDIMRKLWRNEFNNEKVTIQPQKKIHSIKKEIVEKEIQNRKERKSDSESIGQLSRTSVEKQFIAASGLFDSKWYNSQYPDVKKAGVGPISHFCEYGWKEGRNPSEMFNTRYYLDANPDVTQANMNPLLHYLQYGRAEGRSAIPEKMKGEENHQNEKYVDLIRKSSYFDSEWYLQKNIDVKMAKLDPAEHFFSSGWQEGREPSTQFSIEKYLLHYPEVSESGLNPLLFYILYGKDNGHLIFDSFKEINDLLPALSNNVDVKNTACTDILLPVHVSSTKEFDLLVRTITSVINNAEGSFQFIIIDDASPHSKVKKYLRALCKRKSVIDLRIQKKALGFVKSVNQVLETSNNHVVLLDIGVEVPPGWLSRLMSPIWNNPNVSSVSPMTNAGELSGYPIGSNMNNSIFDLDVESIDNSFKMFAGYSIKAPVGIVPCMALNRKALDTAGYFDSVTSEDGESRENIDWCRRAIDKGFTNIITPGLFVHQEKKQIRYRKKKRERIAPQKQEILNNRFSKFTADFHEFIKRDNLMQFRFFSFLTLGCQQSQRRLYLLFDHISDTGSNIYSKDIISKKKRLQPVCVIRYNESSGNYVINTQYLDVEFEFEIREVRIALDIFHKIPIDEISLNSLRGYPEVPEVLDLISLLQKKTDSNLVVSIHDFNSVCPNHILLDGQNRYCLSDSTTEDCNQCKLIFSKKELGSTISDWRKSWKKILDASSNIRMFSHSTHSILKKVYPDLDDKKILLQHPKSYLLRKPKLIKGEKLHIGVIGNISAHKGSQIVDKLSCYLKDHNLGKISVIGTFDDAEIKRKDFPVSGPYYKDRLPEIIERRGINVCFFPSVWPETFSYVTAEIISMEIPLLVFDIGEPAESVREYANGKVIPLGVNTRAISVELEKLWQLIPSNSDKLDDKQPSLYFPENYYEEKQIFDFTSKKQKVRLLAYHLPQFYTFPENDIWWGTGFTDWTNVRKAKPLFDGHYQPRKPHDDIGYYRLDKSRSLRKQAELCNEFGLYGFCFYHYWFGGKRLMEKPVDLLLKKRDINLNFCLCWANEGWTRSWDGNEKNVLIAQNYSPENDIRFIEDLRPYLEDPRYIRVNGKPLIMVYRIDHMPFVKRTTEQWRVWCLKNGLGEIYLLGTAVRSIDFPEDYGFDALVERPFFNWNMGQIIDHKNNIKTREKHSGVIYWHDEVADFFINQDVTQENGRMLRSVGVMWDPSARLKDRCLLVHKTNPKAYQRWLTNHIKYTEKNIPEDERFILLNAWNEWAEGAYLEPDKKFGYAMLNATARAIMTDIFEGKPKKLILEDVLLEIDNSDSFAIWQKSDLKSLFCIISKYYKNPEKMTVLDVGCSCKQVEFISRYVKKIIGINIKFLTSEKEKYFDKIENAEFLEMSGTELDFSDGNFDLVYSLNVFEHINDLSQAVDEQIRVLKNDGLIYNSWGPIWSGPNGHHIHDDMVRDWEKEYEVEESIYKNNGEFIKDWSHLLLSEDEMFNDLLGKLKNRELTKHIVNFVYNWPALNRIFFDDFINIIANRKIHTIFWENIPKKNLVAEETLNMLQKKHKREEFYTSHCEVLFAKQTNPRLKGMGTGCVKNEL